jgi:hypothetical protein
MMMRHGAALAILALLLAGAGIAGDGKAKRFEITGICSIGSPGMGYDWKLLQTQDIGGTKAHICLCKNQDASGVMVLIVEMRTSDTDAKRAATLKAHWNSLVGLKDRGYADLKGKPPSIEPPIPDQVHYAIDAKDQAGADSFIRGATIFGKQTYGFQVIAKSLAEANRLVAAIKDLKETK